MKLEKILKRKKIERPFGIFLSGGLDSGILAALLKPDFAITCNFKGEFYDELAYTEATAKHLKIPLTIITPDGSDFKPVLEKALKVIGNPVNSVSIYPWYKIMEKVTKMGAKRMVGGEGCDEAFGGYSRYLILKKIHELYNMESLKGYGPLLDSIFTSFIDTHSRISGIDKEILKKRYKEKEDKGIINQIGWAEFNESLEPIRQMELRLAKYFGLDMYLPFYDKEVQDYGWSLKDDEKIKGETRKLAVYNIAKKYLPTRVYERKDKKGFGSPANEWCGSKNKYDKTKYLELQREICKGFQVIVDVNNI